MAATPPGQIMGSPRTPPTPLHGASYDHEESPRRFSARLRQKRAFEEIESQSDIRPTRPAKTPKSPRFSQQEPRSPHQTPQRKSTTRQNQTLAPPSPDTDFSPPKPTVSHSKYQQPLPSAATILTEGMLPTPVKTPNKKHKIVDQPNLAARALFQDRLTADEAVPTPRKNRKNKRFNGFSLESFRADNDGNQPIQVFTDSRDQVPVLDQHDDNPFVNTEGRGTRSKKITGTTKRRKVSAPTALDTQVEEALEDDDGMVYVFRGKKVYRRFDNRSEEEEEIDIDDLGLLARAPGARRIVKPLKTLTRKSIRPTRLFQTEQQKRAKELEKEEEATTDVDEHISEAGMVADEAGINDNETLAEGSARISRVKAKPALRIDPDAPVKKSGKKTSPFDSWRRVKRGSAGGPSSSPPAARGRKRGASEAMDEPLDSKT